jgi:biopolymer transport protein ExbB/TolQ
MKNDQLIDAVQTIGIVTIAIVLSYVVVVLEGTLNRCADRLRKVLIHQDEIIEATDRIGRRIETIEAVVDANKSAIKALSNQLNGKRHEGSSVDHLRTHVRSNMQRTLSRADRTRRHAPMAPAISQLSPKLL